MGTGSRQDANRYPAYVLPDRMRPDVSSILIALRSRVRRHCESSEEITLMKRLFGALIVGTFVFGAVIVSASVLPVNGGSVVQAGGDTDLTCQTTPVDIGWGTLVAGDGKFHVESVVISNVDATCNGEKVLVALMQGHPVGSSGATMVGFLNGTLTTGTTTLTFSPSGSGPLASAVDEVQILFKDASSPT